MMASHPKDTAPPSAQPYSTIISECTERMYFSCELGKNRLDVPEGNMHRKVESFMNMVAEIRGRQGRGGMEHGVRSLGR